VQTYWDEQQDALRAAVKLQVPVLNEDSLQGWVVDALLQLGFRGADSAYRTVDDGFVIERRWGRADGVETRSLNLVEPASIFDPEVAGRLRRTAGDTVVILAYSKTLTRLWELAPKALEPLGPTSAVLSLVDLQSAMSARAPHGRVPADDIRD